MIYEIPLRTVGYAAGALLILGHGYALVRGDVAKGALQRFPRSQFAGTVLIAAAAAWALWLVRTIELGEFETYRVPLTVGIPLSAWLLWRYVPEFLSVRALGVLMLLAAEPMLEAAFLRPEMGRLLLVSLAYAWIIVGMFWVGMPYLFRDWVNWLTREHRLWTVGVVAGMVYGLLLCLLAGGW